MLAVLLAATSAVQAQPQPCDQVVVDEGNYLGTDKSQVAEAAQRLVNSGAEVRVMVLRNKQPYGNIDRYQDAMGRECPSWRAGNSGTRNNLIVIWLFMEDHESYITYGSEWAKKLDNKWNSIRADVMGPKLRDGKTAAGLVAGLTGIKDTLEYEPVGFGTVFLWILVVGLFIFLVIYIPQTLLRRRREREKRRAAQQQAKLKIASGSDLINELEQPIELLKINMNDLESKSSADDAEPYRQCYDELKASYDTALLNFGNLKKSDNDPETDGLSVDEYDAMTESYQKVESDLTQVRRKMGRLVEDIAEFKRQIDRAPTVVSEAQAAIELSGTAINAVAGQDFKVEAAQSVLTEARRLHSEASAALGDKHFFAAIDLSQQVIAKANEAQQTAERLPELKTELKQGISLSKERIPVVDKAIDAGHALFLEISAAYAESSWRTVQGNGTEAENRIDWSGQAIAEAERLATMEVQGFAQGLEILEEVGHWLDQAESFMRSITALKTNLEAAKRDVAGEIEAAQSDIDKAVKYIAEYDGDIRESLETDLAQAQSSLEQAKAMLAAEKPDYIQVVKLARQVNATADRILDEAEDEHEAAERLRQRARTSLREAERSISASKEYIEDHRHDIRANTESTTESLINEAETFLLRAKSAVNAAEIVKWADASDQKADRALEMAEADVSEAKAEAARRREQERLAREKRERLRREREAREAASYSSDDDDDDLSFNWGTRNSTTPIFHSTSHSTGFNFGGGGGSHGGGGSWGSSSRGGGGGKW